MGNRPTDWHVLDLDDDPVPGDPERVKQLARELHDFAGDVADALRQIKSMAGEDALLRWAGKTAKAFQDEFEEVPKNLKKLQRSYDLAGDALAAYWPKLERAQSLADKALARGREARSELSSATGRLDSANSWVERATDKTEEYDEKEGKEKPDDSEVRAATRNATDAKSAQTSAQTAVDNAESGLEAAKKMAADAKKMREDAASDAKDKLEDASDAGIQNRKWWEKAVDWVKDNWDTIVNVCKVIVAVLGIVVLIIGGPLAWVVLAAALVVLADTLYKYANGEASLWDVAFAALDCIPGMKGLTTLGGLAKGLKGLKGGMAAVKGGLKAMALGLRGGLRKAAMAMRKRVCLTDPVDVVTGEMVMTQTDVDFPALLPLVLDRAHVSGFRSGRCYGGSWASTLDQRLEIDDDSVTFHTDDGMALRYPVPEPDVPTHPLVGPKWPLRWNGQPGGDIRVERPETGQTLRFSPLPESAVTLPLHSIIDRNGQKIEFERHPNGMPVEVRHSGGYRIGIESAEGRVAALRLLSTPEQPILMRYAYDRNGNLTDVVNSSGKPLRHEYDDRQRITAWRDRNGTRFSYTYDDRDRCTATIGTDGILDATFVYDDVRQSTSVTDSQGNTLSFRFDDRYRIVREADPLGQVTRQEWDTQDRLASRTDPLDRTTTYAYDGRENLVAFTRPDGLTSTARYNSLGLVTAVSHPDGSEWRQEYDGRGNLTLTVDPNGDRQQYTYDERGHLTQVIDALGGITRMETDSAGLPVSITDPLGQVTTYQRGPTGHFEEIIDPLGGTTRFTWSTEGKLIRRALPDGSAEDWDYDGEGNLIEHRGPLGHVTRFEIGAFDVAAARTDPDGTRLEFVHDTELRLSAVINQQGHSWRYEYDPAGRLVRETDFDGRTLAYRYDAAGQLIERTNGMEETVRYRYDRLGNVADQTWADSVTRFEYDAMGRLVRAANGDVDLEFERDPLGRVTAEVCNERRLANRYNALGRRVERRTPTDAVSVWAYDPTGLPAQLTTAAGVIRFTHDAAGREVERHLGSAALEQAWDVNHRLAAQHLRTPDNDWQRSFTYRADGQVDSLTDSRSGTYRFDLDPMGRITANNSPGDGSENYTYDSSGNIVHASRSESSPTDGQRAYTGTRIRKAGRTRYQHDAQGRLIRQTRKLLSGGRKTWEYEWDAADRLVGVTTPEGDRWRYRYDPLGRRVAKSRHAENGDRTRLTEFVWDGMQLAEQHEDGRTTTWDWSPQGHRPVAQTDRSSPQSEFDQRFHCIVTDLVGTPTQLVDAQGRIRPQRRGDLWGLPRGDVADEIACPLGFPGQYWDAETEFLYNLFRSYDPHTGRYTSADPLGLDAGPNPYAYVPNPLQWSDPLGLAPCTNFWTRMDYHGQRVYQRDDLIDPNIVHPNDPYGRTNLKRMQQGIAPIGPDGKSINLHHMLQTQDGPIAELTQSMHQDFSHILHWKSGTKIPSGIDRPAFDDWKSQYWKDRAKGFLGG